MQCEQRSFGNLRDGREITEFTLKNTSGVAVKLISFGAIMTSVSTPDRENAVDEITLGFDSLAGYEGKHPYFGATVGRFANRIGGGTFSIDGRTYSVAKNNGVNHLHGGIVGFDKRVWDATPFSRGATAGVRFSYVSADGEEGYPGRLEVSVTYSLSEQNELEIRYEASTDKPTIVNLTNHTYWNLHGGGAGTVLSHVVGIDADSYLPVDAGLLPTGAIAPVAGTPFDFHAAKSVGRDIGSLPGGYDHCFVIRRDRTKATTGAGGRPIYHAARVFEPSNGRGFDLFATQVGVHFYTGNTLGPLTGRDGVTYARHAALCLETEGYPDSINRPDFPSPILRPGEKYDEIAKLHFFSQ